MRRGNFDAREYRVLASPSVVDLFSMKSHKPLALLSDFIGKSISYNPEQSIHPEQYDIV